VRHLPHPRETKCTPDFTHLLVFYLFSRCRILALLSPILHLRKPFMSVRFLLTTVCICTSMKGHVSDTPDTPPLKKKKKRRASISLFRFYLIVFLGFYSHFFPPPFPPVSSPPSVTSLSWVCVDYFFIKPSVCLGPCFCVFLFCFALYLFFVLALTSTASSFCLVS
jgi:hypothetical protein